MAQHSPSQPTIDGMLRSTARSTDTIDSSCSSKRAPDARADSKRLRLTAKGAASDSAPTVTPEDDSQLDSAPPSPTLTRPRPTDREAASAAAAKALKRSGGSLSASTPAAAAFKRPATPAPGGYSASMPAPDAPKPTLCRRMTSVPAVSSQSCGPGSCPAATAASAAAPPTCTSPELPLSQFIPPTQESQLERDTCPPDLDDNDDDNADGEEDEQQEEDADEGSRLMFPSSFTRPQLPPAVDIDGDDGALSATEEEGSDQENDDDTGGGAVLGRFPLSFPASTAPPASHPPPSGGALTPTPNPTAATIPPTAIFRACRPAAASRWDGPLRPRVTIDRQELEVELRCAVCHDVLSNTRVTSCGHLFCRGCWANYQQRKGSSPPCPHCREPVTTTWPCSGVDSVVQAVMADPCPNDGCSVRLAAQTARRQHADICRAALLECSNEGCGQTFQRHELDQHRCAHQRCPAGLLLPGTCDGVGADHIEQCRYVLLMELAATNPEVLSRMPKKSR